MNTSQSSYSDDGQDFSIQYRRGSETPRRPKSQRPTFGRSRGKTPQQHNGIHRRRRKKIRW